jgi:hypothetical protein
MFLKIFLLPITCAALCLKKCPFCAEDIQDDAIKCKHCGEFLDASTPPRFAEEKIQWKIGLTIGILVLSWFLFQTTMESIRTIKEYYKLIEGL